MKQWEDWSHSKKCGWGLRGYPRGAGITQRQITSPKSPPQPRRLLRRAASLEPIRKFCFCLYNLTQGVPPETCKLHLLPEPCMFPLLPDHTTFLPLSKEECFSLQEITNHQLLRGNNLNKGTFEQHPWKRMKVIMYVKENDRMQKARALAQP